MKRLSAAFALAPVAALAHPGDHGFASVVHLITEPDHLAILGLGAAIVAFALTKLRGRP